MRVCGAIWLLACAALLGCASEGGVTGTGLSAISGNIAVVSEPSALRADPILPFPVRVSIAEFPGIESTTDADGTFELAGAFSGAITLRFADADDGMDLGPLNLEVPAGSQTVLENIEIRTDAPPPERVQPAAVRVFDLFGRADLVECNSDGTGILLVTDSGHPPRQYMVRLTADTDVVARDGAALTCADIGQSGPVRVDGLLRRRDQTVIALLVVVAPPRPPRPGPSPRPERAGGVVDAVSCDRGLVQIDQRNLADPVRRVIRLTDSTEFRCGADVPAPCDCSAIAVGASLAVDGMIFPARPGQIQADVVFLGTTSVSVDMVGTITHLACQINALAIQNIESGQSARVALAADTDIVCRADLPCGCQDLHRGDTVRVQGQRPAEGGPIAADHITVLPSRAGAQG